jgi:cell division protease FtsH
MTGSLVSFLAADRDLVSAVLADHAAREQLEGVLDDARSSVRRLLSRHRHLVEALRDALLERHELIGPEITDVLEQAQTRAEAQEQAQVEARATRPALADAMAARIGAQPAA